MTVRELEQRLGGDELREWAAFQHLYDLPDGFFVSGQVCSSIARYFVGAERPPEYFVPFYKAGETATREQTPDETRAIAGLYFAAARRRAAGLE